MCLHRSTTASPFKSMLNLKWMQYFIIECYCDLILINFTRINPRFTNGLLKIFLKITRKWDTSVQGLICFCNFVKYSLSCFSLLVFRKLEQCDELYIVPIKSKKRRKMFSNNLKKRVNKDLFIKRKKSS